MSDTPLLGLPLMAAAQAQKHVTHNEALMMLDSLVQLAVPTRSLSAPPAAAAVGARYLVAAPGTGDWAGQAGHVALRDEGAWRFLVPAAGWRLWVSDEKLHLVFEDGVWQAVPVAGPLQNIPLLGVATTANDDNRLAVAAANTLLTHAGGDHRLKINKASAANTGSLLFQDNWSGRAEMGLAGDDHFHLKVSADGTTWREAMTINAVTGQVAAAGVPGLRELERAQMALALLPPALRGGTYLIGDCVNGSVAAAIPDGLALKTLEGAATVLATPAGALVNNRKHRITAAAANQLRYHHLGDGRAAGILLEPAFTYLNGNSQMTVAQHPIKTNIVDAATPEGETGAWVTVATLGTTCYAHRVIALTQGVDYHVSAEIIMDDGGVPVVGTSSTAGDLGLVIQSTVGLRNPETGALGPKVEGPYAGGKYIISGYFTATATVPGAYCGWTKYAGQSARNFRIGRFMMGQGRHPVSQFDNATTTPATRAADVLTLPLSGIGSDGMTLCGEFICPPPMAARRVVTLLSGGAGESFAAQFEAGSAALTARAMAAGGAAGAVASAALTTGNRYRFAAVLDGGGRKLRLMVTGGSAVEAALTAVPAAPMFLMAGHDDGLAQLAGGLLAFAVVDRAWSASEMALWVAGS